MMALLGLAPAPDAVAQPRAEDSETLPALLGAQGFSPPEGFKALVLRIDESDDGTLSSRAFDWEGTSDDRDDWWPASSVKIFAAVAALERLHALGFPIRTWITYNYEVGSVTMRADHIVRLALERSSNSAFDRLVELVGFDEINTDFFVADKGLHDTVFLRSYSGRYRDQTTGISSARYSPTIFLRRGHRTQTLPQRRGEGQYACPDDGNCTTLWQLAEVMRRIMLHEHLPESERYDLREVDLQVMRAALAIARNYRLAEIVEEAFGDTPVEVWHKPGYAMGWVSDVMFVHCPDTRERFVVAMAARSDRRGLDGAAAHLGRLLHGGGLRGR